MRKQVKKIELKRNTVRVLTTELSTVVGGRVFTSACSDNCSGDCDPPK